MEKEETILSLDIGTNSVHGILAKYDRENSKVEVLSANTYNSNGIKDGAIIAIQDAEYTIEKFFTEAEKDFNISELSSLLCAVRGSLIEVFNASTRLKIAEDYEAEVTEDTIADIINRIEETKKIDENKEIVEIIPQQYKLDEQEVQDPIGMSGKYLELTALIVVGTKSNMTNIRKSAMDPLLRYGYNALGNTLVSKDDKDLGCILVDIGGMTTGVVVYIEGKIKCSFELNFGSDYVTRDIIKKLKISQKEAKNIKEKYGVILEDLISETENAEFEYSVTNGKKQIFTKRQLVDVIKPQIDLQLEQLSKSFKEKNIRVDEYVGGFILTGGGSLLCGMTEAFEKYFNTVAKIANFTDDDIICADSSIINSQLYTTALAIIKNESRNLVSKPKGRKSGAGLGEKIKKFFEGLS